MAKSAPYFEDISRALDIRIREIERALDEATRKEIDIMAKMMDKPVSTWSFRKRPAFRRKRIRYADTPRGSGSRPSSVKTLQFSGLGGFQYKGYKSNEVIGYEYTTPNNATRDNPYPWIALGTKQRFMLMSSNFRPKTRPGSLGARTARGSPLKLVGNDMGGITGRRWHDLVVQRRAAPFEKRMRRAIRSGLNSAVRLTPKGQRIPIGAAERAALRRIGL